MFCQTWQRDSGEDGGEKELIDDRYGSEIEVEIISDRDGKEMEIVSEKQASHSPDILLLDYYILSPIFIYLYSITPSIICISFQQ